MATLILIRHGQSTWNAANKFTGWVDVPLSKLGRLEATQAAYKLRQYKIDICFTSLLIRAIETAVICLTEYPEVCAGKSPILKHEADDPDWHGWNQYEGNPADELPIFPSAALDERYYGTLQGLNKAETIEKYGVDQVNTWRRSFATRPPSGESLQDTLERTLPYFQSRILAHLTQGENVLVAAHGNSLRSIIMNLDRLDETAVTGLELATGIPIVYEIDQTGHVTHKTVLT
ncbi:2,3-bisphosphoglycerate-dependent phosphoglycerate mutase [Alkalinema sp. FACHB-956]|uniref:2,3-bisphosphoglycerate-dependent phosphoglycerate mutase n=1 Tax=Alkalinema sp. FACHB-956 TaxID=2692768 RepID=UPI0016859D38|nr:2,3-bisphosphoglycerate-dependent phosphoglycerate mutase [Alkalinema sp. FACHB-956]MBD2325734.1 2,3-bisphosphoglycerate-dependent phosphoglycerate mutase [Alkalinema sp. FACHB-956]